MTDRAWLGWFEKGIRGMLPYASWLRWGWTLWDNATVLLRGEDGQRLLVSLPARAHDDENGGLLSHRSVCGLVICSTTSGSSSLERVAAGIADVFGLFRRPYLCLSGAHSGLALETTDASPVVLLCWRRAGVSAPILSFSGGTNNSSFLFVFRIGENKRANG
jgi:hypothetical protein